MQITESAQSAFANLAGDIAEMFSFSPSIGQLYGFLFVSNEPMSLEEIAKACHMSKGNASINLRTLENWGAVHKSWKPGTRKDYYAVNPDIRTLAAKRAQEGISKRLHLIQTRIHALKQRPDFINGLKGSDRSSLGKRLLEVESLVKEA